APARSLWCPRPAAGMLRGGDNGSGPTRRVSQRRRRPVPIAGPAMSETVAVTDAPDNLGTPHDGAGASAETLEQRLRRLEDALAGLQDTRHIEERGVER